MVQDKSIQGKELVQDKSVQDKELIQDNESNNRDTLNHFRKGKSLTYIGKIKLQHEETPTTLLHLGKVLIITSGQMVEVVLF